MAGTVSGVRGLLVALVLIAALAVGADFVVTRAAEDRVAAEVEQSMGGEAQVDLRGWPVTLGLLQGRVDEAVINATSVPLRDTGATMPTLDVLLSDVELPYARGGGEISAAAGRFSARVDQDALTGIVERAGFGDIAELRIAGDRIQIVVGGAAVDLTLGVRDGALVVAPTNGLLSALSGGERVVPMEGLPPGTSLDTVRIEGGAIVLEGPVDLRTLLTAPAG